MNSDVVHGCAAAVISTLSGEPEHPVTWIDGIPSRKNMVYTGETLQTRFDATLEEKIRLSYDPYAERHRVQEMIAQGVPLYSIRHYLEQQALKFTLEHILGVKKTSIEYEMGPDGLIYPGIKTPVRTMFARSAELGGAMTREQSELAGWNKIESLLYQGRAREVVQISPPSQRAGFGNYGMLFHFERREGNKIRVWVNRYDDPTEKQFLTTSRAIGKALGIPFHPDRMERQYLENPVDVSMSSHMLPQLLQRIGIPLTDTTANELEELIREDSICKYYLDLYYQYSLSMNNSNPYWLITSLSKRVYEIGQTYQSQRQNESRIPVIPPLFDGTGCLIIPGRIPVPRYLGNGEHVVTQCPHCHARVLLNREHMKKGIQCTCKATVPAGNPSKCIVEASQPATFYDEMTLTRAGYSFETEHDLATETTE